VRIALLEIPARFGDARQALADAERLLGEGPHPDLALLNELALTGYVSPTGDFDLSRFAEPIDGPSVGAAAALAKRIGTPIAMPFVERSGSRSFNAMRIVPPDRSTLLHYRKRRPWFPETWASRSSDPTGEFELGGARCALAICYDIHFLASESRAALERCDVLLFPSAWVDLGTTEDLRAPIFADLARRFDLTIANANWGPGAPRVGGQGASRVVGPSGEIARVASELFVAKRLDCVLG
jgi:predicted amidohydrolase